MTKVAGLEVHPAADLFPMMAPDELAELSQDIVQHGLHHPLVMYQGQLLDGRNRARACKVASVTPKVVQWDGRGGSAVAYVISANVRRRHLSESQRAMIAADMLPMLELEAAERSRVGRLLTPAPRGAGVQSVGRLLTPAPRGAGVQSEAGRASQHAAQAVGVSSRSVDRAKAVAARSPELAAQVRAGELTVAQADAQLRRGGQLAAIATYRPPAGKYSVISADPPWKYEARVDDETHRGRITYPPMATDEICALDIPAADDCILFLWCTNSFLADGEAARVVRVWGFAPKTVWTWCKIDVEGKPRLGAGNWGRGGTEHVIVAIKGQPKGDFARVANWFTAPAREHSRKPDEFFTRVEACCAHPAKLELFAREHREGWTTSGAEGGQFAAPATVAIARGANDRAPEAA